LLEKEPICYWDINEIPTSFPIDRKMSNLNDFNEIPMPNDSFEALPFNFDSTKEENLNPLTTSPKTYIFYFGSDAPHAI